VFAVETLAMLPYETVDEPLYVLHTIKLATSLYGDGLNMVSSPDVLPVTYNYKIIITSVV
jgi:hypothetical protein